MKFTLQTERLILRPLQLTDIDDLYEYNSDADVTKYMYFLSTKPGETYPLQNCISYVEKVCKEWNKEEPLFFEFAIELKEQRKMIGNTCLTIEKNKQEAEIGWILNKKFHNQGFAYEATKEILNFGFTNFTVKKINAHCDEKNIASSSLMKRLGMKLEFSGDLRKDPNTQVESTEAMYSILKEDFLAKV